jgi:hypothetical protein
VVVGHGSDGRPRHGLRVKSTLESDENFEQNLLLWGATLTKIEINKINYPLLELFFSLRPKPSANLMWYSESSTREECETPLVCGSIPNFD